MTFKNATKSVGLSVFGALAVSVLSGTAVQAEPKYDETLARKIATHVADKLGGLRTGFDLNEKPMFVEIKSIRQKRIADTLEQKGMTLIKPVSFYSAPKNNSDIVYASYKPSSVRVIYDGIIIQN
ncbi:hypothetical protein [Ahrensia marina]|uniref:Uncharacterized protein n=1 Tax=Ahrensia marina TaxID=1514904 RepID=A0A0N0E7G8_9HYPH|nr:hypothetical protein [Ahrensia marina]KPB01132.1 hypothetical protein SU32_09535 [Ahrensia marina]